MKNFIGIFLAALVTATAAHADNRKVNNIYPATVLTIASGTIAPAQGSHRVDTEAAAFWERRGFMPSKDDPLILFRSIADIAASMR